LGLIFKSIIMKERLSFVFYLNWKTQIDEMTNEELRRFIENLISWYQGGEVSLPTREDKFIWNGVLPGLESNEKKYIARAGASRENGKLGGRPSKNVIPSITKQVIKEPEKPVNSELISDNGQMISDNCELLNDNSQLISDNIQMSTENQINNGGESMSTYLKREINICNQILDSEFSDFPFLKSMANPPGIKELYHHIDNEKELERIKPILEKLASLKFKLSGNYV